MVILLGGVWLVSFHAGGGGVDVGTWQEGAEDNESAFEVAASDGRPGHLRVITSPGQLESGGAAPLSPVVAFPSMRSPPTSPDSNAVDDRDMDPEHGDTDPTRSPTSHGRLKKFRRPRFSSFLQPADGNIAGAGFSIGLSPVSPGFAIVPKRRVSGFRSIVRHAAMRRTVSDGNFEGVEHEAETSGEHEQEPEGRRRAKAKARWKWLREIFAERE